jgi:hypothetical protein
MTEAARAAQWTVAGRYELMGVNGSLLPAPLDVEPGPGKAATIRASVVAGELRLNPDGSYRLALTARFDTASMGHYTGAIGSTGRWRFLVSALDPTSGEVLLTPPHGPPTSAAVTGVSLVHRTRGPDGRGSRDESNWIYVRHWQTP